MADKREERAPFDEEAEQSVLGAVFLDPHVMRDIGTTLVAEDFYLESHRAVFRAMLSLDEQRQPIDVVLVMKRLRELELLEIAGGPAYLSELSARVPTAANCAHYAHIVKEKATLRSVLAFARETAHRSQDELEDVPAFLDEVAQSALALSTGGIVSSVVPLYDALRPAVDRADKLSRQKRRHAVTGVPSGFHALDRKTAGWQPSDLIIVAARPGMGKTAFALNMLINAAKDTRGATPGVIFSLEMSKEQLATRLWCAEAQVPMNQVRTGDLQGPEWDRLFKGVVALRDLPIFIDDTPAVAVTEVMRKCRQLKHEHDIGFIVVDYLQLMSSGLTGKTVNREQQISDISRSLKALAKELGVPVVALSQLNRGVESRSDKRPLLSDLRESGAIEQDADIIVFLYRESYYAEMKGESDGDDAGSYGRPRAASDTSQTEVIVAKHRSGSTGKIELTFHGPYTLFTNMAGDQPPPPDDDDRLPHDDTGIADEFDYAAPPRADSLDGGPLPPPDDEPDDEPLFQDDLD